MGFFARRMCGGGRGTGRFPVAEKRLKVRELFLLLCGLKLPMYGAARSVAVERGTNLFGCGEYDAEGWWY